MKPTRLGIDLRVLQEDDGAGVFHAAKELFDAFRAMSGRYDIDVIALDTREEIRKERNVFFPSGAVPLWFHGRAFPWVHDLLIFSHPEWFNQSFLKRIFTTRSYLYGLKRAAHIFAVSQFTKQDVIRIAKIDPEKITVTYEGVSLPETGSLRANFRLNDYFLVLGTLEPRKNLSLILRLMKNNRFPKGFKLVIAGKPGWGNLNIPNHPQIMHVGRVTDQEKRALLEGAHALLLPSHAEGFGRTALEAMSVGTLVIASRGGAIPEVVGDAGILLDANDTAVWASTLARVADNERLRNEWGEKGRLRSHQFSWARSAELMLATIKKLC